MADEIITGSGEEIVETDIVDGEVVQEEETGGKEGGQEEDNLVPVSELQRRLQQANKKHEAEIKRLEAEKVKEIKKAKMTQAEKKAFEIDEREQDIEERERKLNERLLRVSVQEKLSKQGLSETFTDTLVVLGDEELIDTKIEEIKGYVDELVNYKLKDKISQPEPKVESKGNVGKKRTSRRDIFK